MRTGRIAAALAVLGAASFAREAEPAFPRFESATFKAEARQSFLRFAWREVAELPAYETIEIHRDPPEGPKVVTTRVYLGREFQTLGFERREVSRAGRLYSSARTFDEGLVVERPEGGGEPLVIEEPPYLAFGALVRLVREPGSAAEEMGSLDLEALRPSRLSASLDPARPEPGRSFAAIFAEKLGAEQRQLRLDVRLDEIDETLVFRIEKMTDVARRLVWVPYQGKEKEDEKALADALSAALGGADLEAALELLLVVSNDALPPIEERILKMGPGVVEPLFARASAMPETELARRIAVILARTGLNGERAFADLFSKLGPYGQVEVYRLLRERDDNRSYLPLTWTLRFPDFRMAPPAVHWLAEIDARDPAHRVRDRVRSWLSDEKLWVELRERGLTNIYVIDLASELRDPELVKPIRSLWGSMTDDERRRVVEAFGRIGGEEALAALADLLAGDKDPAIRRAAAKALGFAGGEKVADKLLRALEDEDESVRLAAGTALGRVFGVKLPPTAEAWSKFLEEREEKLAQEAAGPVVPGPEETPPAESAARAAARAGGSVYLYVGLGAAAAAAFFLYLRAALVRHQARKIERGRRKIPGGGEAV